MNNNGAWEKVRERGLFHMGVNISLFKSVKEKVPTDGCCSLMIHPSLVGSNSVSSGVDDFTSECWRTFGEAFLRQTVTGGVTVQRKVLFGCSWTLELFYCLVCLCFSTQWLIVCQILSTMKYLHQPVRPTITYNMRFLSGNLKSILVTPLSILFFL